ncbi:hypothetical protein FGO68_gene14163 [Halteria grandinella]|uniref:Uncharacterized protein n=1 Tax=Halteria grandinella TaxID=5974 RepID=A0A8J8T4C5_HALGN|nr:hypothetical protein FGO68_gene14163 [Halteria grandinella]
MNKSAKTHKGRQVEVYSELNQALNINLQDFDLQDAIPDPPIRSIPPSPQHMDILPPGALKHKFPYPDHDEHMRLNGEDFITFDPRFKDFDPSSDFFELKNIEMLIKMDFEDVMQTEVSVGWVFFPGWNSNLTIEKVLLAKGQNHDMFSFITSVFLVDNLLKDASGVECGCKNYYKCDKIHEQDYLRLQLLFSKACIERGFNYLDNDELRDFLTKFHNERVSRLEEIVSKNLAKLRDPRLAGLALYSKHRANFPTVTAEIEKAFESMVPDKSHKGYFITLCIYRLYEEMDIINKENEGLKLGVREREKVYEKAVQLVEAAHIARLKKIKLVKKVEDMEKITDFKRGIFWRDQEYEIALKQYQKEVYELTHDKDDIEME